MFSLHLRSVVLFENWREVAVAVLLNMLRRLQRDVGRAPAFTRMCRRRRHLPSWCLRSLLSEYEQHRPTNDIAITENLTIRLENAVRALQNVSHFVSQTNREAYECRAA